MTDLTSSVKGSKWAKNNQSILARPAANEPRFVSTMLQVKHFQSLIGVQERLTGTPLADPLAIAGAKIRQGTVVSEEGWLRPGKKLALKPNAAKIPNDGAHFKAPCVDFEEFMQKQGWEF